jgi:hypothetical protein
MKTAFVGEINLKFSMLTATQTFIAMFKKKCCWFIFGFRPTILKKIFEACLLEYIGL